MPEHRREVFLQHETSDGDSAIVQVVAFGEEFDFQHEWPCIGYCEPVSDLSDVGGCDNFTDEPESLCAECKAYGCHSAPERPRSDAAYYWRPVDVVRSAIGTMSGLEDDERLSWRARWAVLREKFEMALQSELEGRHD